MRWGSIIALGAILIIDQLSKSFAISQGLIFENKRFGIYLPAIIFVIFLIAFIVSTHSRYTYALALVVAGGASNLVDFIGRGAVIDYLHLKNFYFNLADIAILTGVLIIAWQEFRTVALTHASARRIL